MNTSDPELEQHIAESRRESGLVHVLNVQPQRLLHAIAGIEHSPARAPAQRHEVPAPSSIYKGKVVAIADKCSYDII